MEVRSLPLPLARPLHLPAVVTVRLVFPPPELSALVGGQPAVFSLLSLRLRVRGWPKRARPRRACSQRRPFP